MKQEKLTIWKERLRRNDSAYSREESKMTHREDLYMGDRTIQALVEKDNSEKTMHVRNICAELIESQVDSSIPKPKVTARRKKDEQKAKLIEDMLRNELDRLPFEKINDMLSRTVPIQGGAAFLLEWDNTAITYSGMGELAVRAIHPRQLVPQDGVYSSIEDMDYIILKNPTTKEQIRARYGVDVSRESESEADIKGSESTAQDMVTQYIAFYRNSEGGIGRYSWVNDIELEDIEDYQARRLRRCKVCGAMEPLNVSPMTEEPPPAEISEEDINTQMERVKPATNSSKTVCPYCGASKWETTKADYEEIYEPVMRSDGTVIPGANTVGIETFDEYGNAVIIGKQEPTRVPFYKPDIFPVILIKNTSLHGHLLGDSDLDKIADQQNTTNRLSKKIIDKLLKSGSYITLPDDSSIKVDASDSKEIRIGNPANKALIDVYDMQGNIEPDLIYLREVYEEARQIIGITDSFQGRQDATATSGKAKEFAAAQSAGRLESKRVMKQSAYAELFEAMFKFKLSYADEPRPVTTTDLNGDTQYEEFNRYDFLEYDELTGEWRWNDDFLFSCDSTAPLASNREAMWQEIRLNFQSGAYGNPQELETLVLFWGKMEALHYPTAAETKKALQERLKAQQEQMMMQQQMQAQQMMQSIDAKARQDALNTVRNRQM